MPSMANITIKKADGTTDVIWTALQASAGDGMSATWRNNTVGTTLAQRPTLSLGSKWNGPKSGRRITGNFAWPITQTDSAGNVVVTGVNPGTFSFLSVQNQDPALIKEQAYQFAHLVASAIVKASMEEGYAPRSS